MVGFRRIALFALFLTSLGGTAYGDILAGSKRADVIAELGKPIASANRGTREILLFPNGVRIELEDDSVIDIKGYIPRPTPPPAAQTTATGQPGAPGTTSPPKAPVDKPSTTAKAPDEQAPKTDTPWDAGSRAARRLDVRVTWLEVVAATFLHFCFTLVALRIALRYWEMDALWTGLFAIAAIDAIQHAALQVLGPFTEGFTTIPGVQNTLPGFIMIFAIRHFCFTKDIQTAVLAASAVKLVVMICNIGLSPLALNALFG